MAEGSKSRLTNMFARLKKVCTFKLNNICEISLRDYYLARIQQVREADSILKQQLINLVSEMVKDASNEGFVLV